jgi:hypothetical protein
MISEPMVRFARTVHLSCTDTNTISKRETRFQMTHVTLEFHRVRQKQFSSLWYVQSKPCTYLASRLALSPNGPNVLPLEPCLLGVPSGVSQMIFEPMVHLAQTVQLSGTDSNNISKQTKMRFRMTHIT